LTVPRPGFDLTQAAVSLAVKELCFSTANHSEWRISSSFQHNLFHKLPRKHVLELVTLINRLVNLSVYACVSKLQLY
jgi:hypothetical protein